MPPMALKYICQVTDCGFQLQSLKALISHMNLQHSNNKRLNLNCAIDECSYLYNSVETFRKHLRLNHSSHWENSVRSNVDVVSTNDAAESPLGQSHLAGGCNGAAFEAESSSDQSCWDRFLNEFAKHLAFLKLKITESYMFPKSVAHGIFKDIETIFDTFQESFTSVVKSRLASTGSDWQDDSLLQQISVTFSMIQYDSVIFNFRNATFLANSFRNLSQHD